MTDSQLTAALEALNRAAAAPATLCEPFLSMFPVSGAAVSTVGDPLGSETVSASDELAAKVDELQFDLGEGPCWDALASAHPVLEPDIQRQPRTVWPAFSTALSPYPVGALFVFPVLVGSLRLGAVDLYSRKPLELDHSQTVQAAAMAGAIGRYLLERALRESGEEYHNVGDAFSRRVIHQAAGMVLAQLKIPAADAELMIQGHSFATGRPMTETAQDILDGRIAFTRGPNGIEVSK